VRIGETQSERNCCRAKLLGKDGSIDIFAVKNVFHESGNEPLFVERLSDEPGSESFREARLTTPVNLSSPKPSLT